MLQKRRQNYICSIKSMRETQVIAQLFNSSKLKGLGEDISKLILSGNEITGLFEIRIALVLSQNIVRKVESSQERNIHIDKTVEVMISWQRVRIEVMAQWIESSVAFSILKPFLLGDKFKIKFGLLSSNGRHDSAKICHIQFIYKQIYLIKGQSRS
ncbi:hypothetical protein Tco_0656686 [Tanacetum coccineum]|uniref:Uncharacterized protein n=1 Tax=Tanacetum coccineum TaxID=301880 RepID=A0ABQ4XAQ7_9ASTR